MPYIKANDRVKYDRLIQEFSSIENTTPGDLNYIITNLINNWIVQNGKNYQNLNSAVGVLECAKLEYYRRIASVYEDEKIKENGDVFPGQ